MNHFLPEEKQNSAAPNSRNACTSKSAATQHDTIRVTYPRYRQNFLYGVFHELKARGVQDILLAVSAGLSGMSRSQERAFPGTIHKTDIVH